MMPTHNRISTSKNNQHLLHTGIMPCFVFICFDLRLQCFFCHYKSFIMIYWHNTLFYIFVRSYRFKPLTLFCHTNRRFSSDRAKIKNTVVRRYFLFLVALVGLEPTLLAELDFESSASTNSATGPKGSRIISRRLFSPLPF